MKVLEETPDRLVVQGTTVVAEMGRACGVMALIPVGLIALMGLTALARWAVDRGDLSAGVVLSAPAAGVGLLALWLLWRTRPANHVFGKAGCGGSLGVRNAFGNPVGCRRRIR